MRWWRIFVAVIQSTGSAFNLYDNVPPPIARWCNDQQIREAFKSAAESFEVEILEMDGEADHVHILVAYPPKLAISVLVNNLKSTSSRHVRILNTHLRKQSNAGVRC